MEADTRRMQPASIGMFSIERSNERYPWDGPLRAPPFSPWRINVTALSQRYNLYFVATVDCIAVFVPEFPYQKLGRTPSLVITPTLANENAIGYIDEELPHAINHLIVGDLGNEEILLVARDSGNIDAYHMRAIRDAIDKEPYRFSKDGHADYVGLRAFFSQWVHESAWGLAIHKEARMIAVSANKTLRVDSEDPSAKITVFAFALSKIQDLEVANEYDEDQDGNEIGSEWRTWKPPATSLWNETVPPRNHNYKIILGEGHANNIPSICFANTTDDQYGMWLFSTDIDGDMIAWNIWQKEVVNSWITTPNVTNEMPFRNGRGPPGEPKLVRGVARRIDRRTDPGWLVATLDPKAFAVADDMAEFCGTTPALIDLQQKSFGVTDIAGSCVPGNSQRHPYYPPLERDLEFDLYTDSSDNGASEDSRDDVLLALDSDGSDHNINDAIMDRTEEPQSRAVTDEIPDSSPPVGTEALEIMEDEDASGSNDQDPDHDRFSHGTGSRTSLSSPKQPLSGREGRLPERLIHSAQDDERDLGAYGVGCMTGEHSQAPEFDCEAFPSFPLLHCSVSHMRLFNAPFAGQAHWYCADLLTQMVSDRFAQSAQYALDRLDMIQQIPELGLVIVASQSGRCAVCSTMRKSRDGPLGLRVDWVLPTSKQEKAGLRPLHALLGIAVGPVQGMMKESAEDYAGDGAFQDGSINGTSTSFDTDMIIIESSEDESGGSSDERDAKRLKMSALPLTPPGPHSRREQRAWSKAGSTEEWRGVNYSRRYRIMLTYYDWTVLTYEVAREAPHLGLEPTRKNYRNRSAASTGYHDLQSGVRS